MKMLVGLLLLDALAGCSTEAEKAGQPPGGNNAGTAPANGLRAVASDRAPAAPAEAPALALASDGLSLASPGGAARPVPFGTAEDEAIRIVAASLGEPTERGVNNDCGAGPLGFANFPGGLNLLLQNGRFAGWFLSGDNARLRTVEGIGIGSTRRELDAAYRAEVAESTLGQEFTAGDLGGLLSSAAPDGRVEALWAGMTCMFR